MESLVDGRGVRAELCQRRIRRGAVKMQGECSSDCEEKEASSRDREEGGGDRPLTGRHGMGQRGCPAC